MTAAHPPAPARIHRLRTGALNAWLVESGAGLLLVDTGVRAFGRGFGRRLAALGLDPADIRLIVITHGHGDHVGGLAKIRTLTEAPVLVHRSHEADLVSAVSKLPAGTNPFAKRLVAFAGSRTMRRFRFDPVRPDLVVEAPFDLAPRGFAGRVVPTPGHTRGSLSVLLESGDAFVGDTCFGIFPRSVFPPFAEDVPVLLRTWRFLLEAGARRFYPGHGRPFDRSRLERCLRLQENRLSKSGGRFGDA